MKSISVIIFEVIGYDRYQRLERFVVEFVREPDAHIPDLIFGWMTRGQLLTFPMVIGGLGILIWAYTKGFGKTEEVTQGKTKENSKANNVEPEVEEKKDNTKKNSAKKTVTTKKTRAKKKPPAKKSPARKKAATKKKKPSESK